MPGTLRLLVTNNAFRGLHGTLLTQQPRVRFSAFPNIYFDVAEIYGWRWLEESGQRLDNVNRIHLVLTSKYYKNTTL